MKVGYVYLATESSRTKGKFYIIGLIQNVEHMVYLGVSDNGFSFVPFTSDGKDHLTTPWIELDLNSAQPSNVKLMRSFP